MKDLHARIHVAKESLDDEEQFDYIFNQLKLSLFEQLADEIEFGKNYHISIADNIKDDYSGLKTIEMTCFIVD